MAETHLDGPLVPPAPPGAVNTRIMRWEGGQPVVRDVPMLTKTQIQEIGAAALALPYSEPGDALAIELGLQPSEFYGRPLYEVMKIKQAREAARTGDTAIIESIEDRVVGKPKQSVESHSIKETYEEYLARISREDALPVRALPIQDAEVVAPAADPLEDLL